MAYTPIYSTAAAVKSEAGLTNNANIVDATHIEPYLFDAEGEVTSSVGQKYSLPLSGNSGYANSSAEATVAGIAKQLAAGFVLLQQFSGQGGEMQNMAKGKISHARSRLRAIENGNLRLFGTDNAELSTLSAGSSGLKGWPDNSTAEDDADSGPKYTMNKTF